MELNLLIEDIYSGYHVIHKGEDYEKDIYNTDYYIIPDFNGRMRE